MILVTGATGNAGAAVIHALLDRGAEVRALVRAGSESKLPRGVEAVAGDLNRRQPAPVRTAGAVPRRQGADPRLGPRAPTRFVAQSNDEAREEMRAAMPTEYVDAFFSFFVDGTVDETTVPAHRARGAWTRATLVRAVGPRACGRVQVR